MVALSSRIKDSHLLAALDLVQKLRDDIFTDTGVGQRNNIIEPVYFTTDVHLFLIRIRICERCVSGFTVLV